jgi:hypothetical protein
VPQVSKSRNFRIFASLTVTLRCRSLPDNLDAPSFYRTPGNTEDLIDLLDSKTLWTEYGIDDDIVVGLSFAYHLVLCGTDDLMRYYSHSHRTSPALTSMR